MKRLETNLFSSLLPSAFKAAGPLLAVLLLAVGSSARAEDEDDADLPPTLDVPAGNQIEFQAHGVGVQIYKWSAASSTWVFQAPSAVLFHRGGHVVGIHYAGPTWQSTDGSTVVGTKLGAVTVDPAAIPWLLLAAKTTTGPGVFANVTFVQRVETKGGLAPATPGKVDGEMALVPYSAEYLFYTAK
ncbi:MAG TPA: DUF3455 domain-containing protein [Verrucomicrobiae bacterium]|nr:DUF3455 domain-containing protein [Verrucomicrobiae bacterium]